MMVESIRRSGIRNILRSELWVRNASDQGMYGSGMLIINPPWPLADTLQQSEPWLAECLAQGAGAGQSISWLVEE
jgi:23S rRNA (adenine2030-N6)-methyltransferase